MPRIVARRHHVEPVSLTSRLLPANRDVLVLYARCIGDTPDYVLDRLIETILATDKEFLAWQAAHPEITAASLLGRRRSSAPPRNQPPRAPAADRPDAPARRP